MFTPVHLELPKHSEDFSPNGNAIVVHVAKHDLYMFDESYDTLTFANFADSLSVRMEREGTDQPKIKGNKEARFENVFDLISLAKENDWKAILVSV